MDSGRCSDGIVKTVSSYIASSGAADLPPEVINKARQHILDTLAAIISGSRLKPGQLAIQYARNQAGVEEAQVAGSCIVTSATNAAFANGMMAHADETDDAHTGSRTHPGCSIVPAALAMSEKEEVSGTQFLRGVVVGYDIGCRITQALGTENVRRKKSLCTMSIGGNFGAATAAASVAGLKERQVRHVLSYTAHQALGMRDWMRDSEHVQKAFVFGGMPARNGVNSTVLIQTGFTGIDEPFSGEHNFFETFEPGVRPELLAEGLGKDFEIMAATIKKFPAGLPIQASLEGLLSLLKKHRMNPGNVGSITAHVSAPSASVVDDRSMPDINLQYLLAVTLVDGDLTFEAAHDFARMKDPIVLDVRQRITLRSDPELALNTGFVEVAMKDGTRLVEHVTTVPGRPGNPMTQEMLNRRCKALMDRVLGEDRAQMLVDAVWNLEQVRNMRELRSLLSVR